MRVSIYQIEDHRYGQWMSGRGLSPNTVQLRLKVYRMATNDLGDLRFVSTQAVADWLAPRSGHTWLTYYRSLVDIFDWLQKVGRRASHPLRPDDPRDMFQKVPTPEGDPDPFTPEEEQQLLAVAAGRMRAFLLLGLREGLRVHEIAKFRGDHIVGKKVLVEGKGRKVARLPLHPEIAGLAATMPAGYWFPSPKAGKDHYNAGSVSGLGTAFLSSMGMHGGLHRARHTYATTLLRNGASIETVRRLMRHSSLATTQRYVLALETDLESAIESLGGPAA